MDLLYFCPSINEVVISDWFMLLQIESHIGLCNGEILSTSVRSQKPKYLQLVPAVDGLMVFTHISSFSVNGKVQKFSPNLHNWLFQILTVLCTQYSILNFKISRQSITQLYLILLPINLMAFNECSTWRMKQQTWWRR